MGLARLECQIRVKEQRSTKLWKGKTEDGAHKLSHSVHDMFQGLRNTPDKEIPERYSQIELHNPLLHVVLMIYCTHQQSSSVGSSSCRNRLTRKRRYWVDVSVTLPRTHHPKFY